MKILKVNWTLFKNSIRNLITAIRSIDYLNNLLNKANLEYVYVKTYRPLPYAPSDIDIFINEKDFSNLMNLLKADGFKITKQGVEMRCRKEEMTRIDIYSSIVYAGVEFNVKDLLFSTKVFVKFLGDRDILIPSPDLDALILLLHDVLGHRTINYIDYLYIKHALFRNPSNILQNILNSDTKDTELIKRCLALFLSLHYKGGFENIAKSPLVISPSVVLDIVGNISFRKKVLYGSSLLVDNFLQLYNNYRNTIPATLKKVIQTALFYHRLIIGDRHILR
ncbi:MAG: hypothetical protein QXL89_07785 [Nitrososphaeria archaeon]